MIYFLLLCVLFAVTAVSVTATVCAVIVTLTVIEELIRKVKKNVRRR
ncbi:MAG: hypothetical protein K2J40_06895 [Ruminococcus sp.]|nr:hypothetical protein [Ruminococcus sp.]MDE6781167.1 hypothetical protein [Ruminococcus sp.]